MVKFTRQDMKNRLEEIGPELEALDAEMKPLQDEQAEIANYRRDDEVRINGELKVLNARRAELTNEQADLTRAVGAVVVHPQAGEEDMPGTEPAQD